MKRGYYYLHKNGTMHFRPFFVIEADPTYFDSPFVIAIWKVENEGEYDRMLVDSAKEGASKAETVRLQEARDGGKVD